MGSLKGPLKIDEFHQTHEIHTNGSILGLSSKTLLKFELKYQCVYSLWGQKKADHQETIKISRIISQTSREGNHRNGTWCNLHNAITRAYVWCVPGSAELGVQGVQLHTHFLAPSFAMTQDLSWKILI